MKNKIYTQLLVIGIIVLLFGTCTIPSISKNISEKNDINYLEKKYPEFKLGEFIVKFKGEKNLDILKTSDGWVNTGIPSIDNLNEKHKVKEIERLFNNCEDPYLNNIFKFIISKNSDVLSIVQDYSLNPYVIYAEPNYIYYFCLTPDDSDFDLQWALHNTGQTGGIPDADIDAPEAWDIETGDENIVIAIHDTGVDWDHPDLEENIWINPGEDINGNGIVDPSDFNDVDDDCNGFIDDIRGWDFVNTTKPVAPGEDGTIRDNDPMDFHGHGSHCSGIASAVTDNNKGIAGVCWNCSIMPIRVGYKAYNGQGYIDIDAAAAGLEYAADNGANIISMSWGGSFISELIWDAINYSYSKGSLLIASAGNSNTSFKHYPAGYDNVISVGATDHNNSRAYPGWWGSNYGSWVDVSAPGLDVYSTLFNDTYESWGGTSMAAPHVAGLAALILSKKPSFNQEEILTIIRSTTDFVNSSVYIGTGRINAYKAIQRNYTTIAKLDSNLDDVTVANEICINGTACGNNFSNYSVFYGIGIYPTEWILIDSSTTPVTNNVLTSWELPLPGDELRYTIRLLVYDTYDQISEDQAIVIMDRAPDTPTINGTTNGKAGTRYLYSFNGTDADGDDIKFIIDWDDGTSDTTDFTGSGTYIPVSHTWKSGGTYTVKAKSKDIHGAESDWAELTVTMPRNKILQHNLLFQKLREHIHNLLPLFKYLFRQR